MKSLREHPALYRSARRFTVGVVAASAILAVGACTGGQPDPTPTASTPVPTITSAEDTVSPTPTDLPPSQVLENSEVPTSDSRDGAVQLAEFYLRETTAVLSGADPAKLQSVCDAQCSHCAGIIARAGDIDPQATQLAFATFQGGSTSVSEGTYSVRAQAVEQPGVIVAKSGESTPITGGTIILDLKATFDKERGWTIHDVRISPYAANENTLMPAPGVTPQ